MERIEAGWKLLSEQQINYAAAQKQFHAKYQQHESQAKQNLALENDIEATKVDIEDTELRICSLKNILSIKKKSIESLIKSNERNLFYSNQCLASTKQKVQQRKDELMMKLSRQRNALTEELERRTRGA